MQHPKQGHREGLVTLEPRYSRSSFNDKRTIEWECRYTARVLHVGQTTTGWMQCYVSNMRSLWRPDNLHNLYWKRQ